MAGTEEHCVTRGSGGAAAALLSQLALSGACQRVK